MKTKPNKSVHIYEHASGVHAKWPPQCYKINNVKYVNLSFIKGGRSLLEVDVPDQWLKLRSSGDGHI